MGRERSTIGVQEYSAKLIDSVSSWLSRIWLPELLRPTCLPRSVFNSALLLNVAWLNICYFLQEEEEIQSLQKTISQMEAELDEAQNRVAEATTKLENSEKQLTKV